MIQPDRDARFKTLALKPHLTELERIELDDLLAQRQATAITAKRTGLAGARRKAENKEKYRVGALAVSAGLAGRSDDELRGIFAAAAALTNEQRALYAQRGERERLSKQPLTGNFHV